MSKTTRPKVTLSVWIGETGLIHLEGQAGPGRDQRLHIHVSPTQPVQIAKLKRFLDAEAGCDLGEVQS